MLTPLEHRGRQRAGRCPTVDAASGARRDRGQRLLRDRGARRTATGGSRVGQGCRPREAQRLSAPGRAEPARGRVRSVPDRVELDLLAAVSDTGARDLEECERAGLLEVGSTSRGVPPRARPGGRPLAAVRDAGVAAARRVVAHLVTRPGHHDARIAHHADLAGDYRSCWCTPSVAADHAERLGSRREAGAQLRRAIAPPGCAPPPRAAEILGPVGPSTTCRHGRIAGGGRDAGIGRPRAPSALGRGSDARPAPRADAARVLWALARSGEARARLDKARRNRVGADTWLGG